MRTVPTVIYQVNDVIAEYIIQYLETDEVRAVLNAAIAGFVDGDIEVYDGYDEVVPHFPSIVVESASEVDTRSAVGVLTASHTFNVIPQVKRATRTPAERAIRHLATAVKQVMYNILSFDIELSDGFHCKVWDADQPIRIDYTYRRDKTVRAAAIAWSCKVDIPLQDMYIGGNRIPDGAPMSIVGDQG